MSGFGDVLKLAEARARKQSRKLSWIRKEERCWKGERKTIYFVAKVFYNKLSYFNPPSRWVEVVVWALP